MTKSEILKLQNPSEIWNEMQKNPELRTDGEVWLYMTQLRAKINKEKSTQKNRDPEAYLYIDTNKKKH